MNQDDNNSEIGERTIEVVQTPLFSGLKLWYKAKRESLDLWGFEKYFGCDNVKYKLAVTTYKNLVNEIDHEYQIITSAVGMGLDDLENAKQQRDHHLLDAKRDFIYSLPENYRMWFKKTQVFNSWRTEPSSWGFHESRYWGSRSGLTLRERRVLYSTAILGFVGLVVILIISSIQSTDEVVRDTAWETPDKPLRNIDSLVQAKLNKERKIERRNLAIERNNSIINGINSGFYTTSSAFLRSEIKMLMQLYHDIVYKENIPKDIITGEAISSSAGLIASNNPNVITKRDEYGQPLTWKMNTRIQLTWEDVNWGLRVYYTRKNRENKK